MLKTWCFTKRPPRRLTDICKYAIILSLVWTSTALFAGTPDWLKQAAQVQLPAAADDTDAVVLLDERLTNVSPDGEVRTTYRKAYKILRPTGRSKGTLYVYFDSDTQLTFLKAWSITSQNLEFEVKESDAIETAAFSEGLYADTRCKILQIPAAQPGSVIGYEYQQKQRKFVQQAIWYFQDEIPVHRARFALELPSRWNYTAHWRNHSAVNPQSTGENRWTWDLADIEPVASEPMMPGWRAVAGEFEVSFAAQKPIASGQSYATWADIGRWYEELTKGSRDTSQTIRDKTREIVADATDPFEKIRRLASYVQHSIRYVAIEIGIGGYRPHAAADVLTSGYGDCKDKATLLSAMLRAAGIDSYYILINSERDYLATDFPSPLGFDHVILAIRPPNDAKLSGTMAIITHDKLGSLILFDPTDSGTPFGYLPPSLQSNHGLLVTDGWGELVELPLLPAAANRIARVAMLTLDQSGNLKGTVEETRSGPAATSMRERLLNVPSKRRQTVIQGLLADLIDGAILTGARISSLHELEAPLVLSYDFTALGYAQHEGNLFLFRTSVLGEKGHDLLEGKPRKQPVVFSYRTSESDVINVSLPAVYTIDEVPQSVAYDSPFASYKSETHVAENLLHYTRTYEIKDVRVPMDKMGDLKTFFRNVGNDERGYAIMKAPGDSTKPK